MKPYHFRSVVYFLFISSFSACASVDFSQIPDDQTAISTRRCGLSCAYTFPDGGTYQGQLKDGQPFGMGKVVWDNGSYYEGHFLAGKMNGSGHFVAENGDHYVGGFQEDQLEGTGIFSFSNGTRYSGEFKESEFNGDGILIRHNGDKYVGDFKDNQFHGDGTLYFTDSEGQKRILAGLWSEGQYSKTQAGSLQGDVGGAHESKESAKVLSPEVVLFYQYQMLTDLMGDLAPSRPGVADLYLLSFGGDGSQDVFMKEALYAKSLFENLYGMENRTIELINNVGIVHTSPIASVINLKIALEILAGQMDLEEDILFLYLTSHGSRDHRISVSLGGVPLANLSAEMLDVILEESGIKWKVIAISACYSGGFIKHLKDETSMIITSARADRSSFGCSDDAEMTYFGRAFLQHSLDQTASFSEAFMNAKKIVSVWETRDELTPSEPQIYTGSLIEKKLKSWRQSLDQRVAIGIGLKVPLQ